ncbi:hypothetical protein J6590_004299 [Homalodisca vitripennis]|nr:hypothetical protein J6590_004299 [Homalodisca vitripennis]
MQPISEREIHKDDPEIRSKGVVYSFSAVTSLGFILFSTDFKQSVFQSVITQSLEWQSRAALLVSICYVLRFLARQEEGKENEGISCPISGGVRRKLPTMFAEGSIPHPDGVCFSSKKDSAAASYFKGERSAVITVRNHARHLLVPMRVQPHPLV